jgi:hypothetical protein
MIMEIRLGNLLCLLMSYIIVSLSVLQELDDFQPTKYRQIYLDISKAILSNPFKTVIV